MSEASAWTTLRAHLMATGPCHVQRLEDKLTPGVADSNVCLQGREVWLEGKFLKDLPKRDTTPVRVGLTPEQATWHENRQAAGGRTYVWVRVRGLGWMLFEDRFRALQDGIPLHTFIQEPVYATGKELVAELCRRLDVRRAS